MKHLDKEFHKDLDLLISDLPRVKLIYLPTPLEDCLRFSQALGGPRILIKRDDNLAFFGGSKNRKVEFIFGNLKAKGADVLIFSSQGQSNEARLLSAAAAKVGIKSFFISSMDEKSKNIQGNLLLDYIFGTDIRYSHSFQRDIAEKLAEDLRKKGHTPYIIGYHDKVLGTVAFVELAFEIVDQLNERGIKRGYIFLASEGATQAGLVLGLKIIQADFKVIGFNQLRVNNSQKTRLRISRLANEAAKLLGLNTIILPEEIQNYCDYVGKGYGEITKESLKAIELLAQTEGILLDPVYTGKAMAGLIDYIRNGLISHEDTVVFLHTGGTPLLFTYNKELIHGLKYRQKVFSRLYTYMIKAHKIIREKGMKTIIHRSIPFFFTQLFRYQRRWIFLKDLNDIVELKHHYPKTKEWDFKIINSLEEANDLQRKGFSINAPFSMSDLEERLYQKQIVFCIFINKKLAHWTWCVLTNSVQIYPPLKDLNYQDEAYLWQVLTAPDYRGLNLYTFTLSKICEHLRNKKLIIILTILKNNTPSIKAAVKNGFNICGEINFYKILFYQSWQEKRYEKIYN